MSDPSAAFLTQVRIHDGWDLSSTAMDANLGWQSGMRASDFLPFSTAELCLDRGAHRGLVRLVLGEIVVMGPTVSLRTS